MRPEADLGGGEKPPASPVGLRWNPSRRVAAAAVLLLCGLYIAGFVDRGWIPHDEGLLAQSAERALAGELPHRDFDEPYSGGLTWLHALAFRIFGVRLLSLRWVLLLFFFPFAAAIYAIAGRLVGLLVAGLITLLAVVWSVPNYFASLPSWYNLFFATFGLLALLKHLETNQRRWLLVAGICAGVSILFLITGLYDVAIVLLFLAYREQVLDASSADRSVRQTEGRGYRLFKVLACVSFIASLVYLCRRSLGVMGVLHYVVPGCAVTGYVLFSEFRKGGGPSAIRFRRLRNLAVPFALGLALPLALYAVRFSSEGALSDLARGLFVIPQRQVATARTSFPPVGTLWSVLPYACLLAFPEIFRRREKILLWALLILGSLLLLLSRSAGVYDAVWNSARSLGVVVVLVGCGFLAFHSEPLSDQRRQRIYLLVCASAMLGLVQFPFPGKIYFCYFAPIVILAIGSIVAADSRAPRWLHAGVLAFYLLFGMFRLNKAYIIRFMDYSADAVLNLDRGGLRVPSHEAREYESLVREIRGRAENRRLYAGPDSPEVYFLAARPNPTRFFFDFQEPSSRDLLGLLQEKKIDLVALNRAPNFSPPLPEMQSRLLRTAYPHWQAIGRFVLLWR